MRQLVAPRGREEDNCEDYHRMKSSSVLIAGLATALVFAAADGAFANPRAAEASGADFLVAADDLSGWHVGGFYRYQSREIDHGVDNLSQDTFAFHVGRDIFRWISVYGFVGTVDSELEESFYDADMAVAYGAGAWINLVDQDLLSTLALETKFRLQANAQISAAKPEIGGRDCEYTETYATLTFSVINEIVGNKNLWPDALAIFFGPSYSKLDCDELDATGDSLGLIFGLDVYISRNVSLSASYETYGDGDDAINLSVNCRF